MACLPAKAREEELAQLGLATWRANPRICLLGDTGKRRLPIFSFLIRHADRWESLLNKTDVELSYKILTDISKIVDFRRRKRGKI